MFTIGEFSRVARVTARQLRHYEELGIFTPEHISPETGYRYYSALQLPRLNRILALKELGLTLTQILQLLEEEVSAEEIRGMLRMRKAQIEQAVQSELTQVRNIEVRLRQIEEQSLLADDIVLKAIPAQNFLSIRQVIPSLEDGFALMTELQRIVPRRVGNHEVGHFAVVLHSENFDTENSDIEMGFLVETERVAPIMLSEGRVISIRAVPAVEAAATMVCVGLANHDGGYGTLGTWIEQHHYRLAGPSWEVFIEPLQPGKLDEAVIEIQLPVTKDGSAANGDLV
ncbi:MAG TPA: MerR family transcriptional regulator [Ktedonobacterales bacterium]|nr:MerR family transcriptional regulator [Ktedonobacterales bacterium]